MSTLDEQEQALALQANSLTALAHSLTVTTQADYTRVLELITTMINPVLKEVDATFDDLIADAYKAHRNLIARKAEKAAPFEQAKSHIQFIALEWRRAEQAKAAEVARLARVEQERIARETQINRLKEQRAEEISLLMQQGQVDQAQEAISKVMAGDLGPLPRLDIPPIAPSYTPPVAPEVPGVSTRTYWHFQVTNSAEIKREYMTPDEKLIKKIVESKHKDAEGIVGGIQVWPDEGMATRGRR